LPGWKDLGLKTILVVTFFLFLKISANLIEFIFTMLWISTPEIISPFVLVTDVLPKALGEIFMKQGSLFCSILSC
jgi:hypothetical protein